jgi:hypothetical protein
MNQGFLREYVPSEATFQLFEEKCYTEDKEMTSHS